MKNHTVSLLFLFSCWLSGCEESTISPPAKAPKHSAPEQKPVPVATQQPTVMVNTSDVVEKAEVDLIEPVEPVEPAKPTPLKKPIQTNAEPSADLENPSQEQPELDLSVSFDTQEISESETTYSKESPDLLPDLFVEKEQPNDQAVQLEKGSAEEGVGIDITVQH